MSNVWSVWQQSGEDVGQGKDYVDLTKEALQELLEERGLPKTGNKDELIARLEEDDES
jgi:hypothetical protein